MGEEIGEYMDLGRNPGAGLISLLFKGPLLSCCQGCWLHVQVHVCVYILYIYMYMDTHTHTHTHTHTRHSHVLTATLNCSMYMYDSCFLVGIQSQFNSLSLV